MKSNVRFARLDPVCSSIIHIYHEHNGCDWQLKNFLLSQIHRLFLRGTTVSLALNLNVWIELTPRSTIRRGHMTPVWPVRSSNFPGQSHLFREEHIIQWETTRRSGTFVGATERAVPFLLYWHLGECGPGNVNIYLATMWRAWEWSHHKAEESRAERWRQARSQR